MLVQQDLYRALLDACPDAVLLCDAQGAIRAANPAASQRYGYTAAELTALPLQALDDRANSPTVPELIRRCLQGETVRCTVLRRRKDGTALAVEVQATVFTCRDEILVVAFERDNSSSKQQEQLSLLRAELAETSSLVTLSELVIAVRHELNQPLAALRLYSDAAVELAAAGNSPALRDCLRRMTEKLQQTAELIRGKLVAPAALALRPEPVNLPATIHELLAYLDGELKSGDIQVTLDLADEASFLLANRAQVQQVLVQLLRNAIEALSAITDRPRVLRIATACESEQIRVSISDTGPGLEPAIAQRLFVPLQTTIPARLGLGLAICRRLLEGLGGELGLQSSSPQGTTFYFTLPRAQTAKDAP